MSNITYELTAWDSGTSSEPYARPTRPAWDHLYLYYNIISVALVALHLRSGSVLGSIKDVNLRRVRLVLGWVTVSRFDSCPISVRKQPPRSTQPGHPSVGRRNEYQPTGGDALRLGSKGRYGSCVGGRQNCVIPCSTRATYKRFRDVAL